MNVIRNHDDIDAVRMWNTFHGISLNLIAATSFFWKPSALIISTVANLNNLPIANPLPTVTRNGKAVREDLQPILHACTMPYELSRHPSYQEHKLQCKAEELVTNKSDQSSAMACV